MTENKRYNIKPSKIIEDGFCIQDNEREHSFPTIDDKSHLIMYEKALNEQDERIKELETRNKRQYELLKKIGDIMWKRDWKTLGLIVDDWEDSERLLQEEWDNCGDVE